VLQTPATGKKVQPPTANAGEDLVIDLVRESCKGRKNKRRSGGMASGGPPAREVRRRQGVGRGRFVEEIHGCFSDEEMHKGENKWSGGRGERTT
jgi:hypothetical protein